MTDDIDNAINVYNWMKERNFKPNVILHTAMMSSLAKGKKYEKLTKMYSVIPKEQVFPNVITLNTHENSL